MIFLFKICKYILGIALLVIIFTFASLGYFKIIPLNVFTLILMFVLIFIILIIVTTVVPAFLVSNIKKALFIDNNPVRYHRLIKKMEKEKWLSKAPLIAENFLVNSNVIYLIYTKKIIEAEKYLLEHDLKIPNSNPKYINIYFEKKSLHCLITMLKGNKEDFIIEYGNLIDEIQYSNEIYKSHTVSLSDVFNTVLKIGNEILCKDFSDIPNFTLNRIVDFKNITQVTILYYVNEVIYAGDLSTDNYFKTHQNGLFK